MALDLRRCAEAAAHAALAEAFSRPEAPPPAPRKRRLGAVRAVLLGAGLVTGARLALKADLRKTVTEGLLRRLPLEEILDELDLDMDLEHDLGLDQQPEDVAAAGHRA